MRLTPLAAAFAVALAGYSPAAFAQTASEAEVAELKAQVAALMERLEQLEASNEAQTGINLDTAEARYNKAAADLAWSRTVALMSPLRSTDNTFPCSAIIPVNIRCLLRR